MKHNSLREQAFTLLELMVSIAILGIVAGSAIWGLNLANNNAAANRLFTDAHAIARDQIDRVLSVTPFNPQLNPAQIPAELVVGVQTQNNVPIYTDPVTGIVVVTGTTTTTVTDPGTGLNMRRITVVVQYQYRNRTYQVSINTLRTSDT